MRDRREEAGGDCALEGVSGWHILGFHTAELAGYWAAAQGSRTPCIHSFPPKQGVGRSQKLWWSRKLNSFCMCFPPGRITSSPIQDARNAKTEDW